MIKYKTIQKEISKPSQVTCDWCGYEFDKITTQCNGYGMINISFGYGSVNDGEKYRLEICDDCFESKFRHIVHKREEERKKWLSEQ